MIYAVLYPVDATITVRHRALMASSLPNLRRAAPRLIRPLLSCSHHRCLPRVAFQPDLFKEASLKHVKTFKSSTRRASSIASDSLVPESGSSSLLSLSSKSSRRNAKKTRTRFFPRTSQKSVAYWLLGSAASVFGIVVFGGLTRLTESGYFAQFQEQVTRC